MTGEEIRAYRESRGWTQAEFGRRVAEAEGRPPYHYTTVLRWERGLLRPRVAWRLVLPILDAEL